MTYRGHVENGVVVFDGDERLPEGTVVRVEPLMPFQATDDGSAGTLAERLKGIVGSIDDLPADYAQQHDHYIHGTPRR